MSQHSTLVKAAGLGVFLVGAAVGYYLTKPRTLTRAFVLTVKLKIKEGLLV